MPQQIELPDDLVHELEQEVVRQRLPLVELLRAALRVWRTNREVSASDRERVMQVLRERGLLGQLPEALAAQAQPLTAEELERLAARAAQGGPVSELIIRDRRGEV